MGVIPGQSREAFESATTGPAGVTPTGGETGTSAYVMLVGPVDPTGRRAYLPRRVWVARDGAKRPILSLTLFLSRKPKPDEESVWSLIERGYFSVDVTLKVPEQVLGENGAVATPWAVFARSAIYRLIDHGGQELARMNSSGPGAQAALTASLDGARARGVLSALSGGAGGMSLEANVVVDDESQRLTLSVEGSWGVVYDEIAREAGGAGTFAVEVIERAVQRLLQQGRLRADVAGGEPGEILGAVLRGLLRSGGVILERIVDTEPARYRLIERPDDQFVWTHRETLTKPCVREVRLSATLEEVLGGTLDGQDWSTFVRLVSPEGPAGGYEPVPRRSRGVVEREDRDADPSRPIAMALVGTSLMAASAVTLTARPTLKPMVMAPSRIRQILLTDGVLEWDWLDRDRVRRLPVVSGEGEVVFPDRIDPSAYWYLPSLEIVEPNPAGDTESSPFLFSFERIGATNTGEEALIGSVRLTLRSVLPTLVRQELMRLGNPTAQPVEMLDLDVALSIPFIDSADGQRKRTTLRPTLERTGGQLVATFDLANKWVRLAYGVLSLAEFQGDEKAKIAYSFRYECYRKTHRKSIRPVIGLKDTSIPVTWGGGRPGPRPFSLIASAGVLKAGSLQIRFQGEGTGECDEAPQNERRGGTGMMMEARPVSATLRPVSPIVFGTAHPLPVEIIPQMIDQSLELQDWVYVQQSVGVQGGADVLMACNQFGAMYRQKAPEGWRAIGCQDALRLGQASVRLYGELAELANGWFRVLRCLPQPGRFLVLPRAYRIARYPPSHERAFLPAAMVYAVLDPVNIDANRYRFVAMVEPDIPPFAMRELRAKLAAYAPALSVQIDLPTDVAVSTDLPSMPLASAIASPRFTVTGVGVQVVLECSLPDALILRNAIESGGILGRLMFAFGDGSWLESDVEMNLGQICGPWLQGPVSVDWAGSKLRLVNRIERSVDVSEVRIYTGAAAVTTSSVGKRLEVGASAEVDLSDDRGEVTVVFTTPSGGPRSLEESRIYIEDVTTNVVFACGVDFVARGIKDIEVYARLRGVAEEKRVTLTPGTPRIGEAKFVVPLSSVVGSGASSAVVEYRVVRVMTSDERVEKGWRECRGALIDLQWDLLA